MKAVTCHPRALPHGERYSVGCGSRAADLVWRGTVLARRGGTHTAAASALAPAQKPRAIRQPSGSLPATGTAMPDATAPTTVCVAAYAAMTTAALPAKSRLTRLGSSTLKKEIAAPNSAVPTQIAPVAGVDRNRMPTVSRT